MSMQGRPTPEFWCHQCRRSITSEHDNPSCPHCGGGFVELVGNRGGPRARPDLANLRVDDEELRGRLFIAFLHHVLDGAEDPFSLLFNDEAELAESRQGASEAAVNALDKVAVTTALQEEHGECSVCMDVFEADTECLQMPCAHVFHPTCLKQWLERHNTCPVCRHELECSVPPPRVRPSLPRLRMQGPSSRRLRFSFAPQRNTAGAAGAAGAGVEGAGAAQPPVPSPLPASPPPPAEGPAPVPPSARPRRLRSLLSRVFR